MGGAENDVKLVAASIKKSIIKNLKDLKNIPIEELVEKRYQKFRTMGEYIKLDK